MEEKKSPAAPRRRNGSGGAVTQYRLYFLHADDGHISHSHEFEAADDERAVRVAESWREGRRAELWSGPRKIGEWPAD